MLDRYGASLSTLAPKTRKDYLLHARSFLRFLAAERRTVWTMGADALARYASSLQQHSTGTVRLYVKGARFFLEWLEGQGLPVPKFQRAPRLPRVEPATPREPLTPSELWTLWRAAEQEEGPPHGTAISVLLFSGMRVGEACAAPVSAIQWVEGGVGLALPANVTKTRKARFVPLPGLLIPSLVQYLRGYRPRGRIFDGLEVRALEDRVGELSETTLKRRITPHVCRHTWATLLYRAKVDPQKISAILGHERDDDGLTKTDRVYIHKDAIAPRLLVQAADQVVAFWQTERTGHAAPQ